MDAPMSLLKRLAVLLLILILVLDIPAAFAKYLRRSGMYSIWLIMN